MIVCSCNVLSDRQIRDAAADSQSPARTAGQVYRCLGCSAQCGRCARTIRKLIADVNAANCGGCARECPAHALADAHPLTGAHPLNDAHAVHHAQAPSHGSCGSHVHPDRFALAAE